MIINQKISTNLLIGCATATFLSVMVNAIWTKTVRSKPLPLTTEQTILPNEIPWEDNLDLAGIETAQVLGNPSDPKLYVLRGKMSPQTILPAHTHPDNRITTVLSGTMYYGTGNKFDSAAVKAYPAGSIVYTTAGTPHFMWAKDEETILQHTGIGPTEIEFLTQNHSKMDNG